MDPSACQFVSPFALISSATHRSPFPISDFDGLDPSWYANLYSGSILHVCPPALPTFVKKVLPTITVPFKLLTNNSDYTLPKDFPNESEIILKHPLLIHWFAQNCILDHPKLTRVPIGLDYHSLHVSPSKLKFGIQMQQMHPFGWGPRKPAVLQEQELMSIYNSAQQFFDRTVKCYANFQFAMRMGYGKSDRPDALNTIPRDLVFYEPTKVTRDICWKNMVKHAFVISPHGNGLDCHRTWEALALGCIPIVKSSGMDSLFDELPVWIVRDWKEVTFENMKQKVEDFKNKTFGYEKLTLKYWVNIINTYD
jgi:hypothetical protein